MPSKHDRKKFFVDPKVQGMLLKRATRYWFLSLALVGCITILGWIFVSPGIGVLVSSGSQLSATLSALVVAVFASMLLLPVALFDLVRVSNRFVGPMFRLRGLMEKAASGEPVGPIRFRDGDVWEEFATAFNNMNDRLQMLEAERQKRHLAGTEELTSAS